MKSLICTFVAILMVSGVLTSQVSDTWNHDVKVDAGPEVFDNKAEYYAYHTYAYETNRSDIRDLVRAEVASKTGKKVNKKSLKEGMAVSLPKLSDQSVQVFTKSENFKKSKEMVKVSVAFLIDGKAVNPTDFPDADKKAREIMKELGVLLNQSVVGEQIAQAESDLEKIQKDYDKVAKDLEKAKGSVMDYDSKMTKKEADKAKYDGKLVEAQADAARLETLANASTADAKTIKKYSKAKDKVMKIEKSKLSAEQDYATYQQKKIEAETNIKTLETSLSELQEQLDKQTTIIENLKKKYDAVAM